MHNAPSTRETMINITCNTYSEALAQAAILRALYAGADWTVSIERPLFKGDAYRVVVA